MKREVVFTLSLFIYGLFVNAQIIVTDPELPIADQPVTIYFDSSKDPGALKNFTGDLYTHTGVILEGSSNWMHVIGTWGDNSTQPKLTYLSNYQYSLSITPDINTFYNVQGGEVVKKMAFVIRSADAAKQTVDLFVDVFELGLNINITSPSQTSLVIELNDTIDVSASATLADSISLFINDEFIKTSSDSTSLTHTILADEYGEKWVKVVAYSQSDFVADFFFYFVRQAAIVEALPAGVQDGINYTTDTLVTLVLHAPNKNHLFVIGDFTDWLAREKGYMKVTPDTARYWIEISGLTPQIEYRYQYLVDGETYIADPYADKILDPWNDPYITNETYPGLIEYPEDYTSGIVSVLQTAQEDFQWQVAEFQPPAKTDLVIYELLIRDFIARHDYQTLIDTLSYLDSLGVNAIELMPVNEFEGNLSWGYNPSFYFAPDKFYGPKEDFKAFVDSCHGRGMAVIMDMVLNHSYGQSPLVQLYFDKNTGKPAVDNPWYNVDSPNTAFSWGYDFNHESHETKDFVDSVNAYWLTEYNINGFRFDFTKGFTNTPGDGGAYDASRISILKRMADHIWNINPNAYVILEHFSANSEEKELAEYGMLIWGNMNHDYAEAAMGYSANFSWGTSRGRGWNVPHLVTYMESHDEERLMYKTITFGNSSGNYNTKDFSTAIKRMELDAVFFLTIPGPKMIWQFGELGYDISINENGRVGEKPIKWDYLDINERLRLYQVYQSLIKLRKVHEAFRTSDYSYSLSSTLKRLHLNHTNMKVTILGNFDVIDGSIDPGFQENGIWYEYFTGDSIDVTDVNETISLQPGEYKIFTTRKLEAPDIISDVDEPKWTLSGYSVSIYPNPSPDEFHIVLKTDKSAYIMLEVIDLSGRKLKSLFSKKHRGVLNLTWDGRNDAGKDVPSSIYFLRAVIDDQTEVYKLVKQ